MLSESEIAKLETGIARILRLPTPLSEDDQARVEGLAADVAADPEVFSAEDGLGVFAESGEAENVRVATSFYQVYLGRQPDPAGLTFWVNGFESGALSFDDISRSFSSFTKPNGDPTEFADLYGNLSVEAVVREFYKNNLERDPLVPNDEGLNDVAGFTFWVNVTNARIKQLTDGGVSADRAFQQAIEQLAIDFVFATETQDVVFKDLITTLLVNVGLQGDDALDVNATLFDVDGVFRPEAEQLNAVRWMLALNSVEGATEVGNLDEDGKFVVAGDPDVTSALRLTGDASVRIDLTDPREQLEGIDIDGDGVISLEEQDQAFRDIIDVSFFEIFDAHPRGDALLNSNLTKGDADNIGFSGDIYFDGTGFGGDGRSTNGNIVLGGYGEDRIFTGIGNDFIASSGLNDEVKAGRNADFIYQELSVFDTAPGGDGGNGLGGDLGLIDGGSTFDSDPGQDSDWLLLEAGDDEETVTVDLAPVSNEDRGFVSTRLGNDGADIANIENVNASGNFYGFLRIRTDETVRPSIEVGVDIGLGSRAEVNQDGVDTFPGFYAALERVEIPVSGTPALNPAPVPGAPADSLLVTATLDVDGFEDFVPLRADAPTRLVDVTDPTFAYQDVFSILKAAFEAQGRVAVLDEDGNPVLDDEGNPVTEKTIEVQIFDGNGSPIDDGIGPMIRVVDLRPESRDFGDPSFTGSFPADDGSAGRFLPVFAGEAIEEAFALFDDLYFGDNRDFSEQETEFRIPGLSPGVTAQMIITGSDPFDDPELGERETGNNILIAGYDNDNVRGGGGDDLLFGGDLEFLLTWRHNPNLFDLNTRTVSVNAGDDGVADDGRDTLIGGSGSDSLVWEADAGDYFGGQEGSSTDLTGSNTLWLTTFSVGRLDTVARSTDGSKDEFLAFDPSKDPTSPDYFARQDFTGLAETSDEADAADAITTDGVLRFDLGVGWGGEYQGNGDDPSFRGDLAGADRDGTADQTNYAGNGPATVVAAIQNFNASGLGAIDYLAAGTNDPELNFENAQNYRRANTPIDIRGIDTSDVQDDDGIQLSAVYYGGALDSDLNFTLNQLLADFNVFNLASNGTPLAPLVASFSNDGGAGFAREDADFSVPEGSAKSIDIADYRLPEELDGGPRSNADNQLFAGAGDDTLEGRGGDDWLEGRLGDDTFIVALNVADGSGTEEFTYAVDGGELEFPPIFGGSGEERDIRQAAAEGEGGFIDGVNGSGDDINIIARRLDGDLNGRLDTGADGRALLGRDFRPLTDPFEIAVPTLFIIDATALSADVPGFDNPGELDDYSKLTDLTIFSDLLPDGEQALDVLVRDSNGDGVITASDLVPEINFALLDTGVFEADDFTVEVSNDALTEGGQLVNGLRGQGDDGDAIVITFNPDVSVDAVTVEFDPPEGDNGGYAANRIVTPPITGIEVEDDEVVFRAYQDRRDDESIPDQQASLGLESYAEDLVVGVEAGTTKLVEDQKYSIVIDDLKDNDTVSLTINNKPYVLTVGFDPVTGNRIVGESTDAFIERFVAFIQDEIALDPHSRDGYLDVSTFNPEQFDDSANIGGLMITEGVKGEDFAEHVYMRFPRVEIANNSGGDAPSVIVKDVSDTAVVLYDYDFRSEAEDDTGLNRGVDVNAQRGDAVDDRFITFEDTTGINRAILQNAANAGELLEGLDIVAFADPTAFPLDEAFTPGTELLLRDALESPDLVAYLPEDDDANGEPGTVPGNGGELVGQPDAGDFSGLHGDDFLLGGDGIDTVLGYTGDDRIVASRNFDTLFTETYNGGVNVVVDDEDGQILEAGTFDAADDRASGLKQVAEDGETLLKFKDTLLLEEGALAYGRGFVEDTEFAVTITGIAEDFSLDGTLAVDDFGDGTVDHTATFLNFEVIRSLSHTRNDALAFSVAGGAISLAAIEAAGHDVSGSLANVVAFLGADADFEIDGVIYDNLTNMGFVNFADADGTIADGQVMGFENVTGSGGDDWLLGGGQDETLSGGEGDDTLLDGDGDDELNGGDGDDVLISIDGEDTLNGDGGDDVLISVSGDDLLQGGTGDDTLFSLTGEDTLLGGSGDDVFEHLIGEANTDADILDGGAGDDVFNLFDGTDPFEPEDADSPAHQIIGGAGFDVANIVDSFLGSVFIQIEADDVDDGDETLTISLSTTSGLAFGTETVTVVVDLADVDVTDANEIRDAVIDALEDAGFDAIASGGGGLIVSDPGSGIRVNSLVFGGTVGDANAFTTAGSSSVIDLRNATVEVERFNLNGGTLVLSEEADVSGVDLFAGPGLIRIIDGDFDNLVENLVTADQIDDNVAVELLGSSGDDTIIGSDIDETILGGSGDDDIFGNEGDDTIFGGSGDDSIEGGAGDDNILGGSGDDEILGGAGDDFIEGGPGDDTVDGGEGDDFILGGGGNDFLSGGAGDDFIDGGGANDTISGGAGDDVLFGDGGADVIFGDGGDDVIDGGSGDDLIEGGDGDDLIAGGFGSDTITGGSGDDIIDGEDGDDLLVGGEGDDIIAGGDGEDTIEGGLGSDLLDGGGAADTFVYNSAEESNFDDGIDLIEFFDSTLAGSMVDDVIDLRVFNLTNAYTDEGGGTFTDGDAITSNGVTGRDDSGVLTLVVDTNNNGVYNEGVDLEIDIDGFGAGDIDGNNFLFV